ncbi:MULTISPECIES: endonuclease VII domain-containing protein [Novosphingobium]|uniref:endonuclease VII domain-containing protein n=1 Tax=Novosphingobium TaxID=165696 RepID=UPI00333E3314
MREQRHLLKYGMTFEQRALLRKQQDARCAICADPLQGGRREHLDHCHATGRVRGLLCSECNTGIGKLKEDPAILRRAVEYLTPT